MLITTVKLCMYVRIFCVPAPVHTYVYIAAKHIYTNTEYIQSYLHAYLVIVYMQVLDKALEAKGAERY